MHEVAFGWRWTISVSIPFAEACKPWLLWSPQLATHSPPAPRMENDPNEMPNTGLVGKNKQYDSKQWSPVTEDGEVPVLLLSLPRAAARSIAPVMPCMPYCWNVCLMTSQGMLHNRSWNEVNVWFPRSFGRRGMWPFLSMFADLKLREPLRSLPVFKEHEFWKVMLQQTARHSESCYNSVPYDAYQRWDFQENPSNISLCIWVCACVSIHICMS